MEINSLKVNQEISDIKEQISGLLDLFYPIGSYYETSKSSFDPNVSWGGTRRRDTNGYVTVGCQDPDESGITYEDNDRLLINAGATKGEVNHTLTINEMPSHTHNVYYPQDYADVQHDTFKYEGFLNNLQAPQSVSPTGGDKPHNNIQPSIGVYRWHRIA